mgnify:CR=1 FL=1
MKRILYMFVMVFLGSNIACASNFDEELCEVFTNQQAEMAKKLPYRIGEFWFNTQYYVSCQQKTVFITKKHTLLKRDEFEKSVAEDFYSQMINSPLCQNIIFKEDNGWAFNMTIHDVEGVYVTNARVDYQACNN